MATIKAGCFLIDTKNKKIALIYRANKKDYSFPKGHAEDGENVKVCAIRETEPKISEIFIMFEPITFPRARSFSPFLAATTLVTSSGKLVPTATIVKPTRASLIPNWIAKN